MHKKFILDTNVLLHDPYALHKFHENHVIIPIDVIEELDHFKRDMSDLGYNARKVVSELDELRKKGKLGEGVGTDGGGLIQVIAGDYADYVRLPNLKKHKSIANQILGLAIYQNTHDSEIPTIIVTKSMNLRLKADALGIYAEDYEEPEYQGKFDYMGYFELSVATEVIEQINKNQQYSFTDQKFLPNEFLTLKSEDDPSRSVLVRVHGNEGVLVKPVINTNGGIMGIKPLNMEQHFAFDALLNDDIKLVSLMGKAGTGKTLVAVAAGLQKVLKEDKYHKLLVSRPTLAMGRDIGFIPGNIDEKMRPWMQPIYDAVELLCEIDRRARKREIPPDILESNELDIEPLAYIRGRSIPHQYMIIDEAQNLTPLEVKTIITRVGFGTKIILTGDPEQIDNPYVDRMSNGFSYCVNRFKESSIAAHITLAKGERSELAELAANIL